mmetsp:Transcript_80734/g.223328  ORF Transcript_80734/g.223328 Transcript_80734/m.223328 type:complete len:90 (-) Transcript_80734:364-633(-)
MKQHLANIHHQATSSLQSHQLVDCVELVKVLCSSPRHHSWGVSRSRRVKLKYLQRATLHKVFGHRWEQRIDCCWQLTLLAKYSFHSQQH